MLGGDVGDMGGEVILPQRWEAKQGGEMGQANSSGRTGGDGGNQTVPSIIQALVISLLDYAGLTPSSLFFIHFIRKAIVFSI